MKKILSFLMVMFMGLTLAAGCKDKEKEPTTLDDVNAFLNDKETMNMDLANTVAIIPFNHINGPKNEWKFYALVNFQYKERSYVKYQVTYLSCTCRAANVNYWQTAYVELTTPSNPESAKLKTLSFDADGTGVYTAGFWGDSDPIHSESDSSQIVATYEKTETEPGSGVYYPSIKEDFIPLLINKTKADIDKYNTVDEMKTEGALSQGMYDSFTGASVSTNNILRILHALFEYHANTWWTEAE